MKKYLLICPLLLILFTTTACHCQCCGCMKRNPITPKDCYYQDYYESAPLGAIV